MANRARTRCPYSPFATCYSLKLIVAALEPIFEIDERRGAFVIARTLERAVIDRLHPGFVGAGAVAAENEPHQPARRLPRHDLSLEKHVAQGDLGATLALGRGQLEPARCLMRVAWCRGEVETTEFVLRVGVAEIGRGVAEHVAGAGAVRRDLRIRYAGQIIMPERDEGVGDEAGLRRARCFVWMAVGDLAEIAERAQVIARYAIAIGIHPAKLPLRHRLSLLGSILQRRERVRCAWRAFRRMRAAAQAVRRRQRCCTRRRCAVECKGRCGAEHAIDQIAGTIRHARKAEAKHKRSRYCAEHQAGYVARYPHSTPSQPLRPDASALHNAPIRPVERISTNNRK